MQPLSDEKKKQNSASLPAEDHAWLAPSPIPVFHPQEIDDSGLLRT